MYLRKQRSNSLKAFHGRQLDVPRCTSKVLLLLKIKYQAIYLPFHTFTTNVFQTAASS